jgi:hypothetical protein
VKETRVLLETRSEKIGKTASSGLSCQRGNIAIIFFIVDDVKSNVVTARSKKKKLQHLALETLDLQQAFSLYIFPYFAK